MRREPVGVCGAITPWNYPLMMAVWKWAPAVAAGQHRGAQAVRAHPGVDGADGRAARGVLPAGVLNVVCGGPRAGAAPRGAPAVAQVSLTGSVRAGRAVAAAAADRLARTHLELGGNAPAVVFADADLAAAAEGIAAGGVPQRGAGLHRGGPGAGRTGAARPFVAALVAAAEQTRRRRSRAAGRRARAARQCRAAWPGSRACSTGCRHAPRSSTGGKRLPRPGWFLPPRSWSGSSRTTRSCRPRSSGRW